MSVVRQPAFVQQPEVQKPGRDAGNAAGRGGREEDIAAHLRPLHDPGAERGGGGQGQGQHEGPSDSLVNALALQIKNLNEKGVERAVGNLRRIARASAIPTDSPLATVGPNARAATFHRGSLLRERYSHAPWRAGRDGANLTTSGKPFAFQSPGYAAGNSFDSERSDIPSEWVKQNLEPEIYNMILNEDRPYNRQLLAAGRYSHIRV